MRSTGLHRHQRSISYLRNVITFDRRSNYCKISYCIKINRKTPWGKAITSFSLETNLNPGNSARNQIVLTWFRGKNKKTVKKARLGYFGKF